MESEQQQTEAAPVDAGNLDERGQISTPAPAAADDVDRLLAEYDAGLAKTEPGVDTPQNLQNATPAQDGGLDALIQGLNADTERANALQSEVNTLKAAEHQRLEREAFDKYSSDLQSRLPEHLPDDYARNALLAAASADPSLIAAFDVRNVSAQERAQAPALLQQAISLYQQIQRMPDTDARKAQALNWVVQRGRYLEAVVYGPGILRKAVREIEDRAHKQVPIDPDATADRNMVAQSVRDSGRRLAPEPPANYGKMSNNEFRQEVRDKFGFDPVT